MKRSLFFLFLVALGAVSLTVVTFITERRANAQISDRASDRSLADLIERYTDRTGAKTTQRTLPSGAVEMNLNDTFQHMMLGKMGDGDQAEAACVTSLGEANRFFGRDLKTGELIAPDPHDEVAKAAALHGMSKEEFEYYSKMAEKAIDLSPSATNITIVNGDGAGEGFNDTTAADPEGGNNGTTRGEQRLILFQYAANLWASVLDSPVTIDVNSQFNSLTPCSTSGGVLGSAGTINIYRDFTGAPFTGTWYHAALANKYVGSDQNTANADIRAQFNTDVDNGCLGTGTRFYYGLNNTTPSLRINLLIVLLHEMGHGLGFSAFVNSTTGGLNGGFPDIYTRYMYDRTTGKYWNDMTDAERLTSRVNAGNVLWDGPNVKNESSYLTAGRDAATGRVQLYVPTTFASGSSISHFDTALSPNALMEPNINVGIPLDLDLTKQQMRDIGWFRDTTTDGVRDTISSVTAPSNLTIGQSATVSWTNTGGFNKNVTIDISTDGGTTYPTAIAANVANTGSYTFTVPTLTASSAKIRVREAGYVDPAGTTGTLTVSSSVRRARFDYDGDGRSDISVFRPSTNTWYLQRSTAGFVGLGFGASGDVLTPADFSGDGKTDISIYRPSTGTWYYMRSEDSTVSGINFGISTDVPVPADYDGDGKADPAVFRSGTWYILGSTNGFSAAAFGTSGDKPTIGDFDGDGRSDIAVYRPSNGTWYRLNSSNGSFSAVGFGLSSDKPVPADYTGDGKTDIAVYRPSSGTWYYLRSEDLSFVGASFGISTDIPTPADYDGDGKADLSVFRAGSSSVFYTLGSTSGFSAAAFGIAEDKPTPGAFVY